MPDAVIVDVVRTPGGKRNGSLSGWHPADLAGEVLSTLVARNDLDPALIEDVLMGCVSQVGAQSLNIGRNAALAAGFPETVPATTIDRQCGSSQQAAAFAAQGVMAGVHDIVIAAGVEVMSLVPMGASFGQGVGFGTAAKVAQADDHSKGIIENALKKTFAPEFLNRIDDVIVFNSLEKHDIDKIIDIEMEKLILRIKDLGYTFTISEKAKDFIAEKGFDKQFGARPLKRAIQKYVEDALAEEIITSKIHEGDEIFMDLDEASQELIVTVMKTEKPAN